MALWRQEAAEAARIEAEKKAEAVAMKQYFKDMKAEAMRIEQQLGEQRILKFATEFVMSTNCTF